MIAGIDGGTTNTKVAWWSRSNPYRTAAYEITLRSTATTPWEAIVAEMERGGIQKVREIGTSPPWHPFQIIKSPYKDPIDEEIKVQTNGLKYLMSLDNKKLSRNCLIVSIGTGVSYTRILGKPFRIPIGSSFGGGYLEGMKLIYEQSTRQEITWEQFDSEAFTSSNPDLLVGDLYPEHESKDLVLSNFGKYSGDQDQICSGAVSVVAVSIVKDLILFSLLTKDIVFIGSAASQLGSLRGELMKYEELLGKNFTFADNYSYAGAVGALVEK